MFFTKAYKRIISSGIAFSRSQSCPNCWGYSQWERDQPLSFSLDKGQCSEINSRNGFIRRFVKRYIG